MIALQYWFEKGFILQICTEAGLGWVMNAGRLGEEVQAGGEKCDHVPFLAKHYIMNIFYILPLFS